MNFLYRLQNETLDDLAVKFCMPKSEILKVNKISASDIVRGKILLLNKKTGVRYVVRPFDSVEKIADKFKTSGSAIREYNGITDVFLGQIIYIPNAE